MIAGKIPKKWGRRGGRDRRKVLKQRKTRRARKLRRWSNTRTYPNVDAFAYFRLCRSKSLTGIERGCSSGVTLISVVAAIFTAFNKGSGLHNTLDVSPMYAPFGLSLPRKSSVNASYKGVCRYRATLNFTWITPIWFNWHKEPDVRSGSCAAVYLREYNHNRGRAICPV